MVATRSNSPNRPPNDFLVAFGLLLFFALAGVALPLPHIATSLIGVYWGSLVAVVVFALWYRVMPTTCVSGGPICSLIAMMVLFYTIGVLLAAAFRFVVSMFT